MKIIPSIDLKDGKIVRLFRGDFATVHTVSGDAVTTARSFQGAGADLIHIVDLDGAKTGDAANLGVTAEIIRETGARAELGGGIRSIADIERVFSLGVYRAIIGSAAVENPDFVRAAVDMYGKRVAVGIDALDGEVRTRGWVGRSGVDCYEFARAMENLGVCAIIFTDISRDGMESGPSFESLRRMRETLRCELIASGGVTSLDDVRRLRDMGLDGAIAGKAVYSGALDLRAAVAAAVAAELRMEN